MDELHASTLPRVESARKLICTHTASPLSSFSRLVCVCVWLCVWCGRVFSRCGLYSAPTTMACDGPCLAVGTTSGKVIMYDLRTGERASSVKCPTSARPVRGVAMAGSRAAVARDSTVHVHSLKPRHLQRRRCVPRHVCVCVCVAVCVCVQLCVRPCFSCHRHLWSCAATQQLASIAAAAVACVLLLDTLLSWIAGAPATSSTSAPPSPPTGLLLGLLPSLPTVASFATLALVVYTMTVDTAQTTSPHGGWPLWGRVLPAKAAVSNTSRAGCVHSGTRTSPGASCSMQGRGHA